MKGCDGNVTAFFAGAGVYFCNRWFSIEMYISDEYNKKYIYAIFI